MSESLMSVVRWIADGLSVAGALFFVISAIGLLRLPDFYCRVHAPTKAATLGVMLLSVGAMLRSFTQGDFVWMEDLAILFFLFLTIPVSSQVLARAARRRGVATASQLYRDEADQAGQ